MSAGLLAIFFSACTSSVGKDQQAREPEHEEEETQTVSLAKTTGTALMTNINEIGLFNGAGRVHCMVIDKADSNHFIAGAATGGLWHSNDRGKTWAPIDDHLPSLNIRSITQNPFQTNTFYASSHTIMRTAPGAMTYRPDIYKSTDGGQTFQLLPATAGNFTSILKVICSPIDQNTVYVLTDQTLSNMRGVWRSQNGGQTFTQVHQLTSGFATDMEILPDGTVIFTADGNIYRSVSGNAGTFTPATITGSFTIGRIDVAFCENQPGNLYGVATGAGGIGTFRSTDGGQSWTFLQTINTGVFTRAIGVKPDNPAFFFAGSVGLYLSQNSGGAFQFYGVGGVDWWSVNFDPHNADVVFITHDQGIKRVNLNPFNPNNNTAYVSRDSLFNCAQIYFGDYAKTGDRVIIGMQDLSTAVAYDGGEHGIGASGDGTYCYFHKQDTTIAYAARQNGDIVKKPNVNIPFPQSGWTNPVSILNELDGDNDGDVDEGANFVHPFWMNNADGQQLYFPTKQRMWRSTNGGDNWQPVSGFYTVPVISSTIAIEGNNKNNPIVYWTIGDTLWVKPNAQTAAAGNEIKIKMPFSPWNVRVDPDNDSIVYITSINGTSGARLMRSGNIFNGNVQFTSLTGDMPDDVNIRSFEINPANRDQMLVGTSAGVYVTEDAGQHWEQDLQFPNVGILRTRMRASDGRVFIFTYGRGAWAASFPPVTSVDEPTREELLAVWPNPSQGIVHVAVPDVRKNTSVQVWSADGRLVRSVTNIQHTPVAVNLTDLSPGNYVIALYEGGKRLRSGKLMKQ